MPDPTSPATIALADERRPHGIEDESLVDHITDQLADSGLLTYEPLSGQYWTSDLPGVVEHVLDLARTRIATDLRQWTHTGSPGVPAVDEGVRLAAALIQGREVGA